MSNVAPSKERRNQNPILPWLLTTMLLVSLWCFFRTLDPMHIGTEPVSRGGANGRVLGQFTGSLVVAGIAWIFLYSGAVRRLDRAMGPACFVVLAVVAFAATSLGMLTRSELSSREAGNDAAIPYSQRTN